MTLHIFRARALCLLAACFLVSSADAQSDSVALDSMPVDTLRLAVLLPFGLQVDTLEGGMLPRKTVRLRQIAMSCLHGVEAAVAQLGEAGVPVSVQVLDETPDSLGRPQYSQAHLGRADVVVGPLMRENVGVVAPKIDRLGKQHVLLTEQPERYVERGPGVRAAVPLELAGVEKLAHWVSAKHDTDRVVLLVTQGNDALLETAFEQVFNGQQRAKWLEEGDSLRYALLDTVQGSRRSVGRLAEHVTPYERNVIVGVAGRSSRSMWAALQTELQMNDSADFVVYAHPEVADMPFVEGELMERWRLTLPLSPSIQWEDSTRFGALQQYRDVAGTDPDKYATLAHDAVLDVGVRHATEAAWFVTSLMGDIEWNQRQEQGAWFNETWELRRFAQLDWCPLDTMPELPPFQPRLFIDPEIEDVIPVPMEYRHLFPEAYEPDGTPIPWPGAKERKAPQD